MISLLNATSTSTPQQQWELKVSVSDLKIAEQTLRVSGETHVGGVIIQLVEKLSSHMRNDWSDYALWWPDKNVWLNRTKMTLDQYGVQADARLELTRIHKLVRLQLPDYQTIELSLDFSMSLFYAIKNMCKEIGLRHAEELSVLRVSPKMLEKYESLNTAANGRHVVGCNEMSDVMLLGRNGTNSAKETNGSVSSSSTLNNSSSSPNSSSNSPFVVSINTNASYSSHAKFIRELSNSLSVDTHHSSAAGAADFGLYNGFDFDTQSLSFSPVLATQDVLAKSSIKYKSIFDKTRLNTRWLDSSKSLMEQNVKENDLIQLRFKYYAFFDLNLKHDMVRVNQIYEQAKWSILSEEIDCTEPELFNFAALQLQIQLQTKSLNLRPFNDLLALNGVNNMKNYTSSSISQHPNFSTYSRTISLNRANSLNTTDDNNSNNGNGQTTTALNNKPLLIKSSSNLIDEEDDLETALCKLEKSLDIDDSGVSKSTNANSNSNSSSANVQRLSNNDHYNEHSCNDTKSTANLSSDQIDPNPPNSSSSSSSNHGELSEYLVLLKQPKYTFKKLKTYYFILNDVHYLSYYKSKDECKGKPIDKINLKSCELAPDVNLASRKFGINLRIPSSEGMNEICLRCPNEESYANWMSALKLASKNKPLSDATYASEVNSILNLLNMQSKKNTTTNLKTLKSSLSSSFQSISSTNMSDSAQVQATNLLPARILKKYKLKQLNDRILEAYSTISDLDIFEAKLRYIKFWQALPSYGISFFAVKVKGSKYREEVIGVASNRLMRINPEGETVKSWRFNTMKSWNVNWDINQFEITFDDEELVFVCLNCEAKILHEFIGAYIYLSLRPKLDNNNLSSNLNEEMFFKLTEKR